MTKKVEITTEENEFVFENNINGDILAEDKNVLVYMEYYDAYDEKILDAFSYDDAVKLRDFLDWLIKKADTEVDSE